MYLGIPYKMGREGLFDQLSDYHLLNKGCPVDSVTTTLI
jgi:hypothetical protein